MECAMSPAPEKDKPVRISVVTVCWNSAATIARTLASVAAQDWPDVEHIVIDGASTDGTQQIVAEHGSHVAQFVSERDKGIYDAMNKGIARATGDVIGILNADDHYPDSGRLRAIAEAFAAHQVDAILGDVAFFRAEAPDKFVRRYNSGRFRPGLIAWGWMPAHPAMFVRRAVYDRFGLYRTDFRIAADFEFVARAFGSGSVSYWHLPQVIVAMQMGGVSTQGLRSTITINREIVRACRANGISTNLPKVLTKYAAKLTEFVAR